MTIRLNPADLSQTRADLGLGDAATKTVGTSNGNVITADSTGLPAINGSQVTALNATNLGSGTVPTARLGSGTASSSTILYGNNTWGAAPASGLNHLNTTTASSSASLDFTSIITSSYETYLIVLDQLMPATHSVSLCLMFSDDNGSTYLTPGYAYVFKSWYQGSSGDGNSEGSNQGQIILLSSAATNQGQGVSGHMWLFSPKESVECTIRFSLAGSEASNNLQATDGMGEYSGNFDIDAFKLFFGSGDIASGKVRVYGLADS